MANDTEIIARLIVEGVDAAKDQLRGVVKEADKTTESIENIGKNGKKSMDDLTGSLDKTTLQTKALAAAQKIYTFAVEGTSVAMKVLKFAIAATGIGALIIALAAIVVNFDKIKAKVIELVPGLANLGDKFKEFKAIVLGVLDGVFAGLKILGKTILAAIIPTPANISAAASAWSTAGEDIARAYKEGFEKEMDKIRIDKLIDALDDAIGTQAFQSKLAKALGDSLKSVQIATVAAYNNLIKTIQVYNRDLIDETKITVNQLGKNGEELVKVIAKTNDKVKKQQQKDILEAFLIFVEAREGQKGLREKLEKEAADAAEKIRKKKAEEAAKAKKDEDKRELEEQKKLYDALQLMAKNQQTFIDDIEKQRLAREKELTKQEEETKKKREKNKEEQLKNEDRIDLIFRKALEKRRKAQSDAEKKAADDKIQEMYRVANVALSIANDVQDFSNSITGLVLGFSKRNADREIEILDDKKKRGVISEKEYNKQVNQIKNEQAQKEHNAQVAEAAIKIPIAGLEAFISGLKYGPVVAGIFAGIAVGFATAQLALIASTPPPKYAKGGWVRGKSHAQGGEVIEAQDKEFVVNDRATEFYTKKFGPKFFDDINTMKFNPILNNQNLFSNRDIVSKDYKMHEQLATIAGYIRQGYKIDEKGNAFLERIANNTNSKGNYV